MSMIRKQQKDENPHRDTQMVCKNPVEAQKKGTPRQTDSKTVKKSV